MLANAMFATTIFNFFHYFGHRLNKWKPYYSVLMTTKQHEQKAIDIVTCGQKLLSAKMASMQAELSLSWCLHT